MAHVAVLGITIILLSIAIDVMEVVDGLACAQAWKGAHTAAMRIDVGG